jgi:osmotically-inducible protein OsmY
MNKVISVSRIVAAVTLLAFSVPVHAAKTDDRIESSAKQSYIFKTYLKGDDIKINSSEGAVTLTGVVSEESHKALASDTVSGLPGVKSVDNKLTVKEERPAVGSDEWLITKVKTTLLFHRSVSAGKTEVFAKDGIVTLRGEAATMAQKELTTEYARDVEGVKDVKNEMTVNEKKYQKRTVGNKIDDSSITAQVKMTLLYHRSTSAVNTSVTTKRGIVTVSGKAANAAEKDLVSKLVADINGVKQVTNRMTVE